LFFRILTVPFAIGWTGDFLFGRTDAAGDNDVACLHRDSVWPVDCVTEEIS
jgi:hypothetical protein